MRKIAYSVLATLLMAYTFSACQSDELKGNAEKFLNAMAHMDYATAKEYSTKETGSVIDLMSQFTAGYPDSMKTAARKTKIKINNIKEEGDQAVVTYTSSDDPAELTLNMVKEDGEWKAQFSKADQAGSPTLTEPGQPTTDPAMDTMGTDKNTVPVESNESSGDN